MERQKEQTPEETLGTFGADEGGAVDPGGDEVSEREHLKEVLPFADGGFAAGVTLGAAQTCQGT